MRQFLVPLLFTFVIFSTARPVAAQSPGPDAAKASPASNPQLTLWLEMKRDLQAPNGKRYFESNLRNAVVPDKNSGVEKLRGTVVSSKPAKKPSELVLALSDDHTPEVTLTLRDSRENLMPLLRPIPPGTLIEFYGIPVLLSQNPFMLTFEVKAENGPGGANPAFAKPAPAKAKP